MGNNVLQVAGRQRFMGREIPVVLGGFGSDAKCISDKTVAELHEMETKNIRARITDNIDRFRHGVDYIDLKIVAYPASNNSDNSRDILQVLGYTNMEIGKAAHIYILSERGYAKLVKIMDTDKAWDIYEHLLDEYFHLREAVKQPVNIESLSPELQLVKSLFDSMVRTELQQKEQARLLNEHTQEIESVNERVDGIRDVVSLTPNQNTWRSESRKLINKIAQACGGDDAYREVNTEIFNLVNKRAGVSLDTRLTNRRRRMAEEGVCKSARDRVNKVDIIAGDKKLIEIYTAIVKEMAVKCGVA